MLKVAGFWKNRTEEVAAIDLGSNSFHMIIARVTNGQINVIDRLKESVRLGYGLDDEGNLDDSSQKRALDCLERFGKRIEYIPKSHIRAVGTRTLRQAGNSGPFLEKAIKALGKNIHIIPGTEEARLVYQGVAFGLEDDNQRRLVIDIGGGSTELIIGENFTPLSLESLGMGCVSITKRFFPSGQITQRALRSANTYCRQKLEPFENGFKEQSWQRAIGCSGSIKSLANVLEQINGHPAITPAGLDEISRLCLEASTIDNLKLPGLSSQRAPVFIGGLVVLKATMEALGLTTLEASPWALREGLLFDLLGHQSFSDMKEHSVLQLAKRFHADIKQANRTKDVALQLFSQVSDAFELPDVWQRYLSWACMLQEVGLDINHDDFHLHGGYIVENCHLAGFGYDEQNRLAFLINNHRKKPNWTQIERLPKEHRDTFAITLQLFRLASVLTRARSDHYELGGRLSIRDNTLHFDAPEAWWNTQPLAIADLTSELNYMKKSPFTLELNIPEPDTEN